VFILSIQLVCCKWTCCKTIPWCFFWTSFTTWCNTHTI